MKKTRRFWGIVLFLFLAGTVSYADVLLSDVSELVEIAPAKTDSLLEVGIRIRGEFSNEMFRLADPERLVIDISPIDVISASEDIELNAAGVMRVRVGRFKPQVARLVFDLEIPSVNYKIEKNADGLKISFWKDVQETPPAEEKAEAKTEEKTAVETEQKVEVERDVQIQEKIEAEEKTAAQPPVELIEKSRTKLAEPESLPGGSQRGFFVQVGGGVATFLKSTATLYKILSLYDQPAKATENYSPKLNVPAVLTFGKYFNLQGKPVKVGVGIEYWSFKTDAAFEYAIPNPDGSNELRTAVSTGRFNTYFTTLSAFGLFRVVEGEKWTLLAGPEIGMAVGKCLFLNDITIEDKAPYTDEDVTVTSVSYEKKTVSGLKAGLQASFEYSLSRHLVLALNLKAYYLSPEIKDRTSKFDLSQAGISLGFQYDF